jgi:hypothetical protein
VTARHVASLVKTSVHEEVNMTELAAVPKHFHVCVHDVHEVRVRGAKPAVFLC